MGGPASPGSSDGPTFAPPPLPPGWIAQWDAVSSKYYFVQLSTGVSQWETPTESAPTGADTPNPRNEHPYGTPTPGGGGGGGGGSGHVITHPDGSQTVKHADGSMEPVDSGRGDGTRGIGGGGDQTGDRSLGVSFTQFSF